MAVSWPVRAAPGALPGNTGRRPVGPASARWRLGRGLEAAAPPRENRHVPQTPAARRELLRARRRRELIVELRVAEATVSYAVRVLGNGVSPVEAAETALEVSAQLDRLATLLRKSVRLAPAHRRVLVGRLIGLGYTREATAARTGVSVKTVQRDLARRAR